MKLNKISGSTSIKNEFVDIFNNNVDEVANGVENINVCIKTIDKKILSIASSVGALNNNTTYLKNQLGCINSIYVNKSELSSIIPSSTDMIKWDSKYEKPESGIPASDLKIGDGLQSSSDGTLRVHLVSTLDDVKSTSNSVPKAYLLKTELSNIQDNVYNISTKLDNLISVLINKGLIDSGDSDTDNVFYITFDKNGDVVYDGKYGTCSFLPSSVHVSNDSLGSVIDGKIIGYCLKQESNTNYAIGLDGTYDVSIYTHVTDVKVKTTIDGVSYEATEIGEPVTIELSAGNHTLTKGGTMHLSLFKFVKKN